MTLNEKIKNYTNELEQKGLLRTRLVPKSGLIHFDSNDYLSLAQDKTVSAFYQKAYSTFPIGSGGSMLLSGFHANHQAVERRFADWLEVDECLLFTSGYAANLAIGSLLGQLKAHCIIDKGVHASIYDGLTLAHVGFKRYLHNDMEDLAQKLQSDHQDRALITEGIFSMSGQMAPLSQITSLCQKSKISCIVDEAHSLGVIGSEGKGAVDFHDLSQKEVPLRMLAFGKAFAAQGAVVAGQSHWIQALMQAGRSLVYTTAISPAICYGLLNTLDVVVAADERRLKLMELINHFKALIPYSPFTWANSDSAIQQLQLGCPHLALRYAQELRKLGISCSAIRAPTVSAKASGLRIILNYKHQPEQITQLFKALHQIYERSPN